MAATLANKDKEKYSKSFKVFTKTVVERNLDVVLRSCFFKRLSLLLKYENMAKCIKHVYNNLHCDICIITIRWVKKGNSKDAY